MNGDLKLLREELEARSRDLSRIQPNGLLIGDFTYPEIRGVIMSWAMLRKFFRNRRPVCWSDDGETGLGAKQCADCRDRSQCGVRVRVHLERCEPVTGAPGDRSRLALPSCVDLELNFTSCVNFHRYAELLALDQVELSDFPTRLTVVSRGDWGEVRFTKDPDQVYA
jgi:hypothetical protein